MGGIDNPIARGDQFLSNNSANGVNIVFIGYLGMMITIMHPTAFDTHSFDMIVGLISMCLYFCSMMMKTKLDMTHVPARLNRLLDHILVFAGLLTPVSLVSVFLPYKPIWLLGFICFYLSAILAHYAYQISTDSDGRTTNTVQTVPVISRSMSKASIV